MKGDATKRILLLTLLGGFTAGLHAQPQPDLGTEAEREAGRVLFARNCAQCHGETGDGAGPAAAFFMPRPRDFTSGIFKFRTTASGELPTDEDLRRSIREGMPYTGMPAWPNLSDAEVRQLIYYIKTFNDDFAGAYGVPEPIEIPRAPRFSEEAARRGRAVYLANDCVKCHGDRGRGDGPSAPTLEDQWGDPIRPADLTKRWTFRNGGTREDIYRTFTTGLDGTPMPSFEVPLEDQWALVDYVFSLSRDEPAYGTVVRSAAVSGAIDVGADLDSARVAALFADAAPTYFPVVGQVVEPGRAFQPAVNGIEVRAVHNADEIAFLVAWHDMRADRTGTNDPATAVPDPESALPDTAAGAFSDAVALQFPSAGADGPTKPYFLFGDPDHPVDLWHTDLATDAARVLAGRGRGRIEPGPGTLAFAARYEDGRWTAFFKRARVPEEGVGFAEGAFVPVAFSVWDGGAGERGDRRGVTAWYHVYVSPLQTQSAALPAAGYGLLTVLIELGVLFYVRKRHRPKAVGA